MNRAEIAAAVTAERLDLCDLLATFSPEEWEHPSLCAGWTVRDVAAHLTVTTRITVPRTLGALVRARGRFDAMTLRMAQDIASLHSPDELLELIRATAHSDKRMVPSGPMDPLVDVVVHGQDIVRAVHRERELPAHAAVAVLDHVADNSFYGARRRLAGLTVHADDLDWSHGTGTRHVTGPAADLLLVCVGRPEGTKNLVGDGLPTLRERVAP